MKTTSFIILMSITLVLALSSFTSNGGSPMPSKAPVAVAVNAANEIDVQAYVASLGLTTSVDEKALAAQYPIVDVAFVGGNNGVEIKFANPTAQNYRLDIYDAQGNILVTYVDIYSETVKVDSRFVAGTGKYLYKLTGEGNTYAGKFSAQLP